MNKKLSYSLNSETIYNDSIEKRCNKKREPNGSLPLYHDYDYLYISFFAESKVFNNNEVLVIGPTPPGTGVM